MLRRVLESLGFMKTPPRCPLIAVVGATGTGKSQLAVALAECFDGEVINGDALQLYRGLTIATNKIPEHERRGIPHHLLGCIGLHEPTWSVGKFVRETRRLVGDIRSRGKLPILVGGTHYYTQALLFRDHILEKGDGQHLSVEEIEERWPILKASPEEMFAELERVDPVMAERRHPNDTRKVRRSLEIWLQTGKRASDVYREQKKKQQQQQQQHSKALTDDCLPNSEGGVDGRDELSPGGMRYDTLTFWVHAEKEALKERLASRVTTMLRDGLIDEIKSMRSFLAGEVRRGQQPDMTRGIWIAIGYKEFDSYLSALEAGGEGAELAKFLAEGVELTNFATRQYARSQVQWIRTKLFRALREDEEGAAASRFFLLDGTDASTFASSVEGAAAELAGHWLRGEPLPPPTSLSDEAKKMLGSEARQPRQAELVKRRCELCDVLTVTEHDWAKHEKSKKHRALLRRSRNPVRRGSEPGLESEPVHVTAGESAPGEGSRNMPVEVMPHTDGP